MASWVMYNAMVRVLPAEQCVLSGSSPSQQKALLAPDPTSVGGLRELDPESNGLSQHLTHLCKVTFLPNWISKWFQKVKSVSLNLKPPQGRGWAWDCMPVVRNQAGWIFWPLLWCLRADLLISLPGFARSAHLALNTIKSLVSKIQGSCLPRGRCFFIFFNFILFLNFT